MSIKVLTVEDSALIRTIINNTIKRMDGVELIGTAENGEEALDKIRTLQPDIITLDMVMPVMDGLEMLARLREFSNISVIVLSALTDEMKTLEALEMGAQDFMTKPKNMTKNRNTFQKELEAKIKTLNKIGTGDKSITENTLNLKYSTPILKKIDALAIGASTGGPKVITSLVCALPSSLHIPVFIVQHMPKEFTASFAKRLNDVSKVPVVEATDGMPVERGTVYIAPGGLHMVIEDNHIRLLDTEKIHGIKPAVDPLFESVAQAYGEKALAILLTGMGKDGTEGCLQVKEAGGHVIAQDESSSVVYGMPKHAVDAGAVDEVLQIEELIKKTIEIVTEEYDERI